MGIKIGADPELVIRDKLTGKYISAHDLIPGTKSRPLNVPGGGIQVDGTAAEFNITPANSPEEFMENIQKVVRLLSRILTQRNKNLVLTAAPIAEFDQEYFNLLPDTCKEMGCDSDFDAWNEGRTNKKPETDKPMRSYGGHIHVGFCENADLTSIEHFEKCLLMTKQLDVALYLPSLLFDTDTLRRNLYGKPGSFRVKSYGCEYRVLSNVWLSDPALSQWVYSATVEAASMLLNDSTSGRLWEMAEFMGEVERTRYEGPGKYPTRQELLNIHDMLVAFGFPKLPDEYLSVGAT